MQTRSALAVLAAAATASVGLSTQAAVLTAASIDDAWGERRNPDVNDGTGGNLIVRSDTGNIGKESLAVLDFDLSSVTVPAGEQVDTVSFDAEATFLRSSNPIQIDIFEYVSAFDEGTATYRTLSTAADGGFGFTPGVDYGATLLGSGTVTGTGAVSIALNAAGVSLVDSYIGTTGSNGFILVSNTALAGDRQVNLGSKDSGGAATPQLTITTVPIPEPAAASLVALGGLAMATRRR